MNLHARFRLLEQNPRIVANQPKLLKEGKPLDPIHRDRKLSGSVFNELLEHCVPDHDVVLSKFILDELKDKPTSKFKSTTRDATDVVALLKSRYCVVTAISGTCDCIITGDKDLLDLEKTGDAQQDAALRPANCLRLLPEKNTLDLTPHLLQYTDTVFRLCRSADRISHAA